MRGAPREHSRGAPLRANLGSASPQGAYASGRLTAAAALFTPASPFPKKSFASQNHFWEPKTRGSRLVVRWNIGGKTEGVALFSQVRFRERQFSLSIRQKTTRALAMPQTPVPKIIRSPLPQCGTSCRRGAYSKAPPPAARTFPKKYSSTSGFNAAAMSSAVTSAPSSQTIFSAIGVSSL